MQNDRIASGMFSGMGRNVLVLGVASFLTDLSSEMIFAVLPLFYLSLGVAPAAVGLIEGIAESTASLLKVYSGWHSDKIGKRKIFVTGGYGFSAASKLLFAFATTWVQVLFVRFLDRVGKGLRTSPRDALIADSTDKQVYGKAFGFHRTMDTAGAVLGVLLALWLISFLSYREIFLAAAIPAFLAVAVIIFFVKEIASQPRKISFVLTFNSSTREFKLFLAIATLFALANFSYVFFMLKAKAIGVSDAQAIMLYLLFNLAYAALAMPAGVLSDRMSRKNVITLGYLTFAFVCAGFFFARSLLQVSVLFAAYGLYYALMEGVQKAYVADLVAPETRGTSYGIFNTAFGLAALPASFFAGLAWQYFGTEAAFAYGAVLSLAAALLLAMLLPRRA